MNYQYGNAKGFDLILPYPIQSDPLFVEVVRFFEDIFCPFDYFILQYLNVPMEIRVNESQIKQNIESWIASDLFAILDSFSVNYTEDGEVDYSELDHPGEQEIYERITELLYSDSHFSLSHYVDKIYQLFSVYYFHLVLPEDFDLLGEFEGDFRMLDDNTAILTIIQPENLNLFTLAS